MKQGKDLDEVCYSHIYEPSYLCDFEVATDELCGHIGMALSQLQGEMNELLNMTDMADMVDMPEVADMFEMPELTDLMADLERLQPLAFHANGSVRGRMALAESDLTWLKSRLHAYRAELGGRDRGFVLPRGDAPVPALHLGRSAAKKAIRALVRYEQEGGEVPMIVPRFCNLVCNYLFTLSLVINHRRGLEEIPFVSKSYGKGA